MGAELDPSYHSITLRPTGGEPDENGCFPNLKTLRDYCDRTGRPVTAYRFDAQVGEKPTDRSLAKIYPEEHHLREMEERLAYEEDAFAADLRGKDRPIDHNLNGWRRSKGPSLFDLS